MKPVLVTGANGFLGSHVVRELLRAGFPVRAAVREARLAEQTPQPGCCFVGVGDLGASPNWTEALSGADTVVHLAARAHQLKDRSADPLAEFRKINAAATEQLARAAARAGVRRFVYVSSLKVNGEVTQDNPFTSNDLPNPTDPYGLSKWEAERALRAVADETGIEVVTLRPPLVYGPGVRANFLRLLDLVYLGLPLPFGSARNRRSLVGVRNLADLLVHCAHHPRAAGETFLVSDGEDVSTGELVNRIAGHLGRRSILVPLPETAIWRVSRLLGKEDLARRLFGSLVLDCEKTRQILEWEPPLTLDEGLAETARWYLESRGKRRALPKPQWFPHC